MRAQGAHAGRGRGIDPEELLAQRSWLRALALRLVGDPAEADDLVQEAWVAAVERPPKKREALGAWLASVVRNRAVMGRRGAGRRARREEASARPEAEASTAELVERAELQRLLAEAVLGLDEPQRTTVLLRYFEDLSAAEIARRLGVPAATVRSRLARGLAELRARLDRRYEGDRGAWQRALLGLAHGLPSAPPVSLPHVPVAEGALALKATTVVASASLAALTLTAVAVWSLRGPEGSAAPQELARVTPAPPAALDDALPSEAPPLANATSEQRSAVPRAAVTQRASVAAAQRSETMLAARILDPSGAPLDGARVSVVDVEAASGADGRVELAFEDGFVEEGRPRAVLLSVAHDGLATEHVDVRVVPRTTTFVGDVVLRPATAVEGRVVSRSGEPLAGVRVLATAVENVRADVEEQRRHGPQLVRPCPETETAADGRFRLAGVPVGPGRVWAGAPGRAWASTRALTFGEGRTVRGVELVLAPLEEDDRIGGIVLDPAGEPVPGARVDYWFTTATYGTGDALVTQDDGRFSILLEHRVAYELTVTDSEDRWSALFLENVQPGRNDLVLRFEEPRWCAVVVTDPDGAPVERYSLSTRQRGSASHQGMLGHQFVEDRRGVARLRVPTCPFTFNVGARGFASLRTELMDPYALPEELSFDLERLPGIRGRVVDDHGEPVAGAKVALHGDASGNRLIRVNGYRSFLFPNAEDETTSDGEGAFVLYASSAGSYVLRAEAEGWAPSYSDRIATDAAGGATGLALPLVRGGVLEGRLVSSSGADTTGSIVAYDRGDGRPRTLRVGPDGTFMLQNLTPGPWLVELTDAEIDPGSVKHQYGSGGEKEPPIAWTCTVAAQETTRIELDVDDVAPCVLIGTLRLDGASLEGFTASLHDPAGFHRNDIEAAHTLAPDGTFRLEVSRPGAYGLAVRAPESAGGRLEIVETLLLTRGDNPWSAVYSAASLSGEGAPVTEGKESFVEYRHGDRSGRLVRLRIAPDAVGRFRLPLVVAGPAELVRFDPGDGESWGRWRTLATFELAPGEARALDLR